MIEDHTLFKMKKENDLLKRRLKDISSIEVIKQDLETYKDAISLIKMISRGEA